MTLKLQKAFKDEENPRKSPQLKGFDVTNGNIKETISSGKGSIEEAKSIYRNNRGINESLKSFNNSDQDNEMLVQEAFNIKVIKPENGSKVKKKKID